MNATMKSMELVLADHLNPGQLMIEDLIGIDGEVVEVIAIHDSNNGDDYQIEYVNDFGENDLADFKYDDLIPLYVYVDRD